MRLRPQQQVRCGATLVEAGLVLGLFLTLIFGMIDLGIGVLRYHIVAEAARQGARIAIVHGNVMPPGGRPLSTWGPAPYSGRGSDQGEIPNAIRPYLIGLDPSTVTLQVTWPNNRNEVEQPVRVKVSVPYQPLMTAIFGKRTYTLSATSTMPIAH